MTDPKSKKAVKRAKRLEAASYASELKEIRFELKRLKSKLIRCGALSEVERAHARDMIEKANGLKASIKSLGFKETTVSKKQKAKPTRGKSGTRGIDTWASVGSKKKKKMRRGPSKSTSGSGAGVYRLSGRLRFWSS